MWTRWTSQQSLQEAEIEDLQKEIMRLKRRLARLERRTDSRSYVPTKSLQTAVVVVEEGMTDDQITSNPSSSEFSFEEFEDPLSKCSFPLYDKPVYDVYEDEAFEGVLDFDKHVCVDQNGLDVLQELVTPSVQNNVGRQVHVIESDLAKPHKIEGTVTSLFKEKEAVEGGMYKSKAGEDLQACAPLPNVCDSCLSNLRHSLCSLKVEVPSLLVGLFSENCKLLFPNHVHIILVDPSPIRFYPISSNEVRCLFDVPGKEIPSIANEEMLKIGRQMDIGWTYPDWFSQPNPPP